MHMQPAAVMRAWFDEVWTQGRTDAIERYFAADAVAHGLPGGAMRGPAGFRPLFDAFRGAFPDLRIDVERTISEGDLIAAHCRVTGTHRGSSLGFPATGRAIDFHGVTLARVVDGQLQEGWNCFDFLTMYQQLGVVPQLPGA